MAIHLQEKFADKIAEAFSLNSLLEGHLNKDYTFSGAKTVKVLTPVTVPLTDYKREGADRYGAPTEMQDTVQELTLSQDKSFALTVDKGNAMDQGGVKAAARMLALQVREQVIPARDKYGFEALAMQAGTVAGNSVKLDKASVCERISEGTRVLDDAEVPADGRTLFLSAAAYKLLKHSDEFLGVDELGEKALSKGIVGQYDNMEVVKVPSGRFPANVNFMIVYRNAATAPCKVSETKLHQDPPGLSGNLLEGRFYYDCFVLAAKCMGVYVEVDTSEGAGKVLAVPSITKSTGVITPPDGASCRFTVDGSDPRYSPTAVTGTTPGAGKGKIVRAYAFQAGSYPSPVAQAVLS